MNRSLGTTRHKRSLIDVSDLIKLHIQLFLRGGGNNGYLVKTTPRCSRTNRGTTVPAKGSFHWTVHSIRCK